MLVKNSKKQYQGEHLLQQMEYCEMFSKCSLHLQLHIKDNTDVIWSIL